MFNEYRVPCVLLALGFGLLVLDFLQTLTIARDPTRWAELWNWFLGAHPSVQRVALYFGGVLALYTAAAVYLEPHGHPLGAAGLALVIICIEAACVIKNYRAGIKP